jgi:signal transduction histidine kinase
LTAVFLLALAMLAGFAFYARMQIAQLRDQQIQGNDRTRRSTLQLLRIQNTLSNLALTARDMRERSDGYPIPAYRPQVDRLLLELQDALRQEREISPAERPEAQQQLLDGQAERLRDAFHVALRQAEGGDEAASLQQLRQDVESHRTALTALVSRLLVRNNEAEERGIESTIASYRRAEQALSLFVSVMAVAMMGFAAAALRYNLRSQRQLELLSTERGELARSMIGMQESILRSVSRELHDDFGQILTAVNATLQRLARSPQLAANESLREQIEETRGATREALERVRDLSQMLHPALIETHGLQGAVERYLGGFDRQSGIRIHTVDIPLLDLAPQEHAIHIFRIVQEALSNITRHSQAVQVWIRVTLREGWLEVEIEDDGVGMRRKGQPVGTSSGAGMGVLAMRERAALLGGEFCLRDTGHGVMVTLRSPLGLEEEHA